MKFWDTSALVPLLLDEPAKPELRKIAVADPNLVIWLFTSVELFSSIARLGRQSEGLGDLLAGMRSESAALVERCAVVTDVDGARRRAERLVGVHPLAAADALQLAAALVVCDDRPDRLDFVTLDRELGRAARLEGFRVLPA